MAQREGESRDMGGSPTEPCLIAIVGMGMRLPGGVGNEDALWDALVSQRDTRRSVPSSRYNAQGFQALPARGYFLDDDLDGFDPEFFGLPPSELAKMDPRQRLLLTVVWECMERAGQSDWQGSDVGCYVGSWVDDAVELGHTDGQATTAHDANFRASYGLSNRLSYHYNLRGPSLTVKAACASSLLALDLGCQAIAQGQCRSAIVASANLILTPNWTVEGLDGGTLSPDGVSRSFDAAANGYARGEAVVAVYIKTLSDALAANDPIRAVIRGTAANSDGRTLGFMTPSSDAQATVMRKAYAAAGLPDPSLTGYVECHGTGTPVGDPVEASAVASVFGQRGVIIGSCKPNFGHTEAASGLAGLLKVVLALERQQIPPNMHFHTPNPKIPFQRAKLEVPTTVRSWPPGRALRASINCFGVGGTNVHAIVESATLHQVPRATGPATPRRRHHLLVYSANSPATLEARIQAMQSGVVSGDLTDLAYTLGARRVHLRHRAFEIVDGDSSRKPTRVQGTVPVTRPQVRPLLFAFTGQGAQWAGMGARLLEEVDVFEESIRHMDNALRALPDGPQWRLSDVLAADTTSTDVDNPTLAQPLSTAFQVGVVDVLRSWGVSPGAVVGHSSGEIAAAYAAGYLSAAEAITVAFYRGQAVQKVQGQGAMAAIGMGEEGLQPFLGDGVYMACENSPQSTTISGDSAAVDGVLDAVRRAHPGIFCRRLRVTVAYHSPQVHPISAAYHELMAPRLSATPAGARLPFYSAATGKRHAPDQPLDAAYWCRNLENPVRFATATRAMLADVPEAAAVLEIGPHSALAGPLGAILVASGTPEGSVPYLPSVVRPRNPVVSLLNLVGQLYLQGRDLELRAVSTVGRVLTTLPAYPWHQKPCPPTESWLVRDWRGQRYSHHELLGTRLPGSSGLEPSWRNTLRPERVPWLQDHVVNGHVVFPGTAYVAMAGAAIQQLSGPTRADEEAPVVDGYTARHVRFTAPLLLPTAGPVDLVTTLRPAPLTEKRDSAWWDFRIASYNGTSWRKHCQGQIQTAGDDVPANPNARVEYPQQILRETLYLHRPGASDSGVVFGPRFQTLENITVSALRRRAAATHTTPGTDGPAADYALHPASLYALLQLQMLAAAGGLRRDVARRYIPHAIDRLAVRRPPQPGSAAAPLVLDGSGDMSADGSLRGIQATAAVEGGGPVACLEGLLMRPVNPGATPRERFARLRMAELRWQPAIDFLDARQLIAPVEDPSRSVVLAERLTLAVLRTSVALLDDATVSTRTPAGSGPAHMARYAQLLRTSSAAYSCGEHVFLPGNGPELDADTAALARIIEELRGTPFMAISEAVLRVRDNLAGLLDGSVDPLALLLRDDTWGRMYRSIQGGFDCRPFFARLGHSHPGLRVLEIGGGTGGFTAAVLAGLVVPQAGTGEADDDALIPLYGQYTFTDISASFFPAAQREFARYPRLHFARLDITQDPVAQGFPAASYDLIVSSNTLHATPVLADTLRHVRRLLAPGGRLVLQEIANDLAYARFVMGIFPGWWAAEDHADCPRADNPWVLPDVWDALLRRTGFTGADTVVYDNTPPYHSNAFIVAAVAPPLPEPVKRVTLLHAGEPTPRGRAVAQYLSQQGYEVHWCALGHGSPPSPGIPVLSLLDLDGPFLDGCSAAHWAQLQQLWVNPGANPMLWPTRRCQMGCVDPRYGLLLGLARTLRLECDARLVTLEVEDLTDPAVLEPMRRVLERLLGDHHPEAQTIDDELCLVDGVLHTGRYFPSAPPWQRGPPAPAANAQFLGDLGDSFMADRPAVLGPRYLAVQDPGRLESLAWLEAPPNRPLRAGEVEVATTHVGLSFRDVLTALGLVSPTADFLDMETAGVVTRTGAAVENVRVGDRVMCLNPGHAATHAVMTATRLVAVPAGLALSDAAGMPAVYGTVIYGLLHRLNLQKGQSVLIHSAAGGVGQAAMHICRMRGAEIYATVGSESKVQFLVDQFQVPRHRIFSSRDAAFHRGIMQLTDGVGVDVVLNSLAGELLHASWATVAPFGAMVELGKRDFLDNGRLSMAEFLHNRVYVGVDLHTIVTDRPALTHSLLRETVDYYQAGHIQPIAPVTLFPAADALEAFQFMSRAQPIGKIVLEMPADARQLPRAPAMPPVRLRADRAYLLVGGMRGLGRSIAVWMVRRGARHLTFLARSAGQAPADQLLVRELEVCGCAVTVVRGDVTRPHDVARARACSSHPIAGVLHLGMVLQDQSFAAMTHAQWCAALAPKVAGTWVLHRSFAGTESVLDFFLLFGSLVSIVGALGQANYAAANTFLAAFAQYRRQLGLPATVIDVGRMDEVGILANNPQLQHQLAGRAVPLPALGEQELLDTVHLAILEAQQQQEQQQQQTPVGLSAGSSLPDASSYLTIGAAQLTIGLLTPDGHLARVNPQDLRLATPLAGTGPSRVGPSSATGGANDVASAESPPTPLVQLLSAIAGAPGILQEPSTMELVISAIQSAVSTILSIAEDEVAVDQPLASLGLDSLASLELRRWWKHNLQLDIDVLEIDSLGNIRRLAEFAVQELRARSTTTES